MQENMQGDLVLTIWDPINQGLSILSLSSKSLEIIKIQGAEPHKM